MRTISILVAGKTFVGTIKKSTFFRDGARIEAAFSHAIPTLPIGGDVAVKLNSSNERPPLSLTGRTIRLAKTKEDVQCGLSFAAADMPLIRNTFYQRRSLRVKPKHSAPVEARVPEGVAVEVYDLSTGGICLLVPEEDQQQLASWTVRLRLRLPGHDAELELRGNVRVRSLSGSAILYGIEFDGDRTPDFETKQDHIHRYVMERQADLLRERAARRAG